MFERDGHAVDFDGLDLFEAAEGVCYSNMQRVIRYHAHNPQHTTSTSKHTAKHKQPIFA